MRIKRTYKETSLKAGQETEIDEVTMRKIANQADTYQILGNGQRSLIGQSGSAEEVLKTLREGKTVETYFSRFRFAGQQALIS